MDEIINSDLKEIFDLIHSKKVNTYKQLIYYLTLFGYIPILDTYYPVDVEFVYDKGQYEKEQERYNHKMERIINEEELELNFFPILYSEKYKTVLFTLHEQESDLQEKYFSYLCKEHVLQKEGIKCKMLTNKSGLHNKYIRISEEELLFYFKRFKNI